MVWVLCFDENNGKCFDKYIEYIFSLRDILDSLDFVLKIHSP